MRLVAIITNSIQYFKDNFDWNKSDLEVPNKLMSAFHINIFIPFSSIYLVFKRLFVAIWCYYGYYCVIMQENRFSCKRTGFNTSIVWKRSKHSAIGKAWSKHGRAPSPWKSLKFLIRWSTGTAAKHCGWVIVANYYSKSL